MSTKLSGESPNFALIGAAGYIAPRHMGAIKENGGVIRTALDVSDSVGVLDSHFANVRFFTEFERFDRYVDRCRRQGKKIDFVSICSPNYLHDAHVRYALRMGADAICEKPLVLNPWNIDGLAALEQETGRKVNTILQLRLHPAILALKKEIESDNSDRVHEVNLTYITSRGLWYYVSWKGDESKSGGIATNIGVHFFDMLGFVFGPLKTNVVHHRAKDCASGYLEYQRARVRWFLSINVNDVPNSEGAQQKTFRSITVDGKEIEFSGGFTDLHALSYEQIIKGNGFPLDEVRPSIETVSHIRKAPIELKKGQQHVFLEKVINSKCRYKNGWPV